MKNIEEQLWDYIDGLTLGNERLALEDKIATDPAYALIYAELLEIQQMMNSTTLEEPSMAFTRNVMDKVNLEMTPVSLKTKVDTRIIYGFAAVFLLGMLSIFIYALTNSTFSMPELKLPDLRMPELKMPALVNSLSIRIFLFVDVVLGLIYMDRLLRGKKV